MSIGVTMEIIGLDKLKKKLQPKNIEQPLNDGIKKATLLLDREVKMATVVGTAESTGIPGYVGGRLRSSMTSQFGAGFGQVGTNVKYAPLIEFGSDWMQARHMEGGTKILGEGMFAFGLRKLSGKMKDLLGDIANSIEARWR